MKNVIKSSALFKFAVIGLFTALIGSALVIEVEAANCYGSYSNGAGDIVACN